MKKENLKNSANTHEILRAEAAQNDGSGDRANTHEILRGKLAQNDGKNESGRSMTEMLGVLAVMGVLSVGGISGYTAAMRKHRANEIVSQLNMMAHECSRFYTLQGQTGPCDTTGLDLSAVDNVTIERTLVPAADSQFRATLSAMPKDQCEAVKTRLDDWPVAAVSGECADDAGNTLTVQFKNDLTAWGEGDSVSEPTGVGNPCDADNPCTGNNYCNTSGKCEACGEGLKPNSTHTDCEIDCGDTAYPDGNGGCTDCPGDQIVNQDGTGCKCPDNMFIGANNTCISCSYHGVYSYEDWKNPLDVDTLLEYCEKPCENSTYERIAISYDGNSSHCSRAFCDEGYFSETDLYDCIPCSDESDWPAAYSGGSPCEESCENTGYPRKIEDDMCVPNW